MTINYNISRLCVSIVKLPQRAVMKINVLEALARFFWKKESTINDLHSNLTCRVLRGLGVFQSCCALVCRPHLCLALLLVKSS